MHIRYRPGVDTLKRLTDQFHTVSYTYLMDAFNVSLCDRDQLEFTLRIMGEIGDGLLNLEKDGGTTGYLYSYSITLFQGPPESGKTACNTLLIGALLQHSRYGQVGKRQIKNFDKSDNKLRSFNNQIAFKIHISFRSSNAVGNIMARIVDNGIPTRNGLIFPQTI